MPSRTKREAFEAAITIDPLDLAMRKVFADFLDENDEPELANFHRSMTVEKYEWARTWMGSFVREANEYGEEMGEKKTFREVMEAARKYLETGESTTVGGYCGFGADNQMVGENIKTFWHAYSILTATPLIDGGFDSPFACCT